ncbi:cyclic GMP-AMP synthase-like receptor 3 [Antedon mediterranea]|uniref:cyclic GMP-AMP synthase-like receptor 3 n=1 Tax=Antedon mediterranea TaxID=105859 RepID=UPI003AF6314A
MCAANLIGALRSYLLNEVNIPQHEQTQAKDAIQKIKNVFVRSHHSSPFNFRQIFHQGSSYEGLKVIAADEFDLLVPLNLSTNWRITGGGLDGYYLIEKTSHYTDSTLGNLIEDGRLNPDRVRRSMQSTVQTVVNGIGDLGMRINLSYSGPAITLDVGYNGRSMSIDIVPSLNIGGRHFVAKSPRHLHTPEYDQLWRESFSDREKSIFNNIDRINECRRDTLKILKTVQKKAGLSQLGMLSSYHLKTCMLHLNSDRPDLSWHQESLADRFKDLVQTLMHFLETRNMPNFFRGSVNLLDRYDADSLNNILGWLRRATRDDEHIIRVLLNKSYATRTSDTFDIFVKNLDGKSIVYQNMRRSTTVKQLKHEIAGRERVPVDQQRLTFESRQLEDGNTLGYYSIKDQSTIYLLPRLRGGR